MKRLVITPELALTISLLDRNDYVGEFISELIAKVYYNDEVDPEDYVKPLDDALRYWFAHIDDILIEV